MDELALIDLVFGEGTKMADELRAKGFDSLEKISQADPARLALLLRVTKKEAREIVQMAINLLSEGTDPLSLIKGVGETTSDKLRKAGFTTIESVSLAEPEEISEKCKIPVSICKKIVASAREIIQEKSFEGEAEEISGIAETAEERKAETLEEEVEEVSDIAETAEERTAGISEEEARVIAFRRRLARLIVKELFD